MRWWTGISFFALAAAAQAQPSLLIITDSCPPETDLESLAVFSAVDTFDHSSGTPTLAELQAYDAVLAYSNDTPLDPVALGDVLADYVDTGRCLALTTYAFSDIWSFEGRIMDPGYSPFQITADADLVSLDGSMVAVAPADPIFTGVNLGALTYQSNDNMSDGTLDPGAILLATDGAGVNMVARASSRPITGFNVFAESASCASNNAEMFRLIANSLSNCLVVGAPSVVEVPALSPAGLGGLTALIAAAAAATLSRSRRRR